MPLEQVGPEVVDGRRRAWVSRNPGVHRAQRIAANGEPACGWIGACADVGQTRVPATEQTQPAVVDDEASGVAHHGPEPGPGRDLEEGQAGARLRGVDRKDAHRVRRVRYCPLD